MKIEDALNEFLIEQAVRGNSGRTIEDYQIKLRIFLTYFGADRPLSDLTLDVCKKYYLMLARRGLSSVTVQAYIRGLRVFLNWLYHNDYLSTDICQKFRLPKAKRAYIDILTEEEVARLYDSMNLSDFEQLRNAVVVSLMLDSGLRLGEVRSARCRFLHLNERYLIVDGKGNKQRAVPFGLYTEQLLREYLALRKLHHRVRPGDALIIKCTDLSASEPITDDTVKGIFRRLREATGIDRLHPHLLRHTFATYYLENGGNIYALQSILGHTSLEMVKKYLHLANKKVREEFVNYSPVDRQMGKSPASR